MGSCLKCHGLDILAVLKRTHSPPVSADREYDDGLSVIGGWHERGRDVFASTSSCELCALIYQGWRRWREKLVREAILHQDIDSSNPPTDLYDDVGDMEVYLKGKISFEFIRRNRYSSEGEEWNYILVIKCSIDGPLSSFDVHDPLVAALRITFAAGQTSSVELASLGLGATVCEDPLSHSSLGIAKGWLDNCKLRHELCRAEFGSASLPTRFLDVNDGLNGDTIYLRESSDDDERRYVALSHCWGNSAPLRLTSSTLEIHKQGIPIQTLPKTFRDSVTIVRILGLRYIWIDSLCIIQDDAEDWRREAGQMAGIYRNAHFVLSADRATSDAEGFLGVRRMPDRFTFAAGSNNSPFTMKLLSLSTQGENPGLDSKIFVDEPLSRRAWCLQERYLARRNLHYGKEQMTWECAELRTSEDGDYAPTVEDQLGRIRRSATLSNTVFNSKKRDANWETEVSEYRHEEWYKMIEDYTSRAITKDPDRIVALLGLRVALESEIDDHYLVGIWLQGLLEGLIWHTTSIDKPLTRPDGLKVPSWTWVSVKGPVRFPIYSWYDDRAGSKVPSNFEPIADYVWHSDTLNDNANSTPELRLAAPVVTIRSVKWRAKKPPESGAVFGLAPERSPVADRSFFFEVYDNAGKLRDFWIDGAFDVKNEGDAVDKKNLCLIFLARTPFVFQDFEFLEHRFGLLVGQERATSRYKRVGFVDGCLISKNRVAAFPREDGDFYSVDLNKLGPDPLQLDRQEVTLI